MKHPKRIPLGIVICCLSSSIPSIQSAFHCTNLVRNGCSSRGVSASRMQGGGSILIHTGKNSRFMGRTMTFQPKAATAAAGAYARRGNRNKATQLSMFLGSDGGILGVGAPEVATILLVGYFILGPTELFKLTKEIGKFIQNIRTLGTEASKSFESTMENQLELQELRKAQSELSNAFNFRRSINVDQEAEAFSELPPMAVTKEEAAVIGGAAAAAATGGSATTATGKDTEATVPTKKKKKRRVKKKVAVQQEESVEMGEIPDLDMSAAFQDEFMQGMGTGGSVDVGVGTSQSTAAAAEETDMEAAAAARLRKERIQRLEAAQSRQAEATTSPLSSSEQIAMGEDTAAAQSRFEAQLSGKWNQEILNNEEKLSPLAQVMERLAILEEERLAANVRLDEEFARRAEVEERFYNEKRMVLEQAAAQISAEAYSSFNLNDDENDGEVSNTISSTTTTQSTTVTETSKDMEKVANNAYFNGMNSNENK